MIFISALGEKTLILHLVITESLATIAREGITPEVIPTEALRDIVGWAIDYYFRSGRTQAPSIDALRSIEIGPTNFGNILDDHEIDVSDDPEDSVEWALDDLRGSFVYREVQKFNRELATEMANAAATDRIDVVGEYATALVSLSLSLVRRDRSVDVREAVSGTLLDYEGRVANQGVFRGLRLGMTAVDDHIFGVHEGELAMVAAGPKVGKSYMLAWIAFQDWMHGRSPALFTLENSVQMTIDRIACMAAGVPSDAWQRGQCAPEAVEAVRHWATEMEKSDNPFWVIQPDLGHRSIEQMVREAQVREADSILIDQLTFVEMPSPRKPKHERIGEALHTLKGLITSGRNNMPCAIAHQINRDGVKAADKVGFHEMHHLAESAECERTADFVFSLYASRDDRNAYLAKFQTLAARRVPTKNWELEWQPERGRIHVRQEINF